MMAAPSILTSIMMCFLLSNSLVDGCACRVSRALSCAAQGSLIKSEDWLRCSELTTPPGVKLISGIITGHRRSWVTAREVSIHKSLVVVSYIHGWMLQDARSHWLA